MRNRNAIRMIGLAAMAGLGFQYNNPTTGAGDGPTGAGGGGGGNTTPPPPAKSPSPIPETTVEEDLDLGDLDRLADDGGAAAGGDDGDEGGGEGGGEEDGAGGGEGAGSGDDEGGGAGEGEGEETTTDGEEGAAAAEGKDATAGAGQGDGKGKGDTAGEGDAGEGAGANDPAATEAARQFAQRVQTFQTGFSALKAKLAEKDPAKAFDPVTDGEDFARTLLDGFELLDQRLAELGGTVHRQRQTAQAEDFWTGWGKQNADVGAAKGRAVWQEEVAAARKKYAKASQETIEAVARERWEHRVNLIRAQAKAANKNRPAAAAPAKGGRPGLPPRPAPAKGGGSVIPRATGGVGTRPPAPARRSTEDRLEAGEYGNLAAMV